MRVRSPFFNPVKLLKEMDEAYIAIMVKEPQDKPKEEDEIKK